MAATGFAYAPNEALQARMAHLAAEGKLVLGDAQDAGIRACLHEARHPDHVCIAFVTTTYSVPEHVIILLYLCGGAGC